MNWRENRALTLCLITDRHRLMAAAGRGSWNDLLAAQVEGATAAGVDVIQIRERGLEDRTLAALVERSLAIVRGSRTRIVVNDRLDVALATGAHGVHLRESSVGVTAVRRLAGAHWLAGRSVHDLGGVAAARGADYLIAGSVFETSSKPGAAASLGLDGLRRVIDAAGECPVWAVGGVTAARAARLRPVGIQGIAAIGAFIPTGGGEPLARRVEQLVQELRFSFDSPVELS